MAWENWGWVNQVSPTYNLNKTLYKWRIVNTYTSADARILVNGTKFLVAKNGGIVDITSFLLDGQNTISPDPEHTWYQGNMTVSIQRELKNTAPTIPGPFTQPTGTLEIGDTKVFTVGASTDAESNLAKYVWEVALNGGAYSNIGETTVPNLTYTIPTALRMKMRVKAVDSAGLESAYRESAEFTLSKPIYYWMKHYSKRLLYVSNIEADFYSSIRYPMATEGIINNDGHLGNATMTDGSSLQVGMWVQPFGSQSALYKVLSYRGGANGTYKYMIEFYEVLEGRGNTVQTGITAVEGTYPTDGKHTDGFWYVRGSRVNQSIAPPGKFVMPDEGKVYTPGELATITITPASPQVPNFSLFEFDYRYGDGAWVALSYANNVQRTLTITTDKALRTIQFRVRNKNTSNVYSDYVYAGPFAIEHNVAPTVSLTNPSNNTKLYENDTINIAGTANDPDKDQSVTAYYQVNSEPKKILATNLSQTQIPLSKQLTFKGGKLYDGEIAISGVLADGVAHTLKVWAEDSEKASSEIIERTFYVVPNRAPLLTVDSVIPSGVVDTDKFKISGTSSDLDANANVTVIRRINSGNAVEIYNGPGGAWEFEISLAQLVIGVNTIVIEVIDNYGAKVSKTIKLNKNDVKTPILHSVARYKIEPPKGSAKGVLLWIQRDEGLELSAELSMTLKGEQESYVPLVATNTAPVTQGIVEDEFYHETSEPKENIILKISMSRSSTTVNNKINLISGVLE